MRPAATCPKCRTYNTFPAPGASTTCRDCGALIMHPPADMPDRDDVPIYNDIHPEPVDDGEH